MSKQHLWILAKALEALGMIVVLVGLVLSVELGFQDEGMTSQYAELVALLCGVLLFGVGFVIERVTGTR
jgi:hypothetical protein